MRCLLRVNCGFTGGRAYRDRDGLTWTPDREVTPEGAWGAVGGQPVAREATLPIHDERRPELYRRERYGMPAYEFRLPDATYALRLHMAETFECNLRPGGRVFDVSINGLRVLRGFDPWVEGGGFARPAVREFHGLGAPDGRLRVEFGANAAVNGIELFRESPRPAPRRALRRVFFIGNSHTFFWAIPDTLEHMIATGANGLYVETERSLFGGKDMVYHYESTNALARIAEGRFDDVVLQGMRADTDDARAALRRYMGLFKEAAGHAGSRLLLYMVWPRSDEPLSAFDALARPNEETARELGITVVPAGPAWKRVRTERPGLTLHNSADTVHSGMHGAYLAACTFYGVLTGQSPEGHPAPAVLGGHVPIRRATAAYLQRAAWATVRRYARGGHRKARP